MLEEMKTLRDQTVGDWEDVLKQSQAITSGYLDEIEKIENNMEEPG